VPTCTQQAYPDGGEGWCSPTSTSMVLGYWSHDTGPCEPRVRAAVAGVYDWVYDGHGNWPFNTAYGATQGLEAYVARFTGLDQAETWIAAGVPVVISYSWTEGALTGAPVRSSKGHLGVIVGFDPEGNPVMNDPAARTDAEVRRTYPRGQLEALWQEHSGGTAYLMYPPELSGRGA
jgi:Peptidase_C39 like family